MSFPGAIIAGLVATALSYVTTRLSTVNRMGLERIFGTMFTRRENPFLGFLLLFLGGAFFGVIYVAFWSVGIGWLDYQWGCIFGGLQWLLLGLALGRLPLVHAGIRSGTFPSPGLYMTRLLGPLAFIAGLMNHVFFGFMVVYVYQFFRTRYG